MKRKSWKLGRSYQGLLSYQGIFGTTFADANFVCNGSEIFIQLHVLNATFEWLHGDVKPVREGTEKWVVEPEHM